MPFSPTEFPPDAEPQFFEEEPADGLSGSARPWAPMFAHQCSFGPDIFLDVMRNLIHNPNINSSWLFRADILFDKNGDGHAHTSPTVGIEEDKPFPRIVRFRGFRMERAFVRKLIPRNTQRDKPLDQTCLIYRSKSGVAGPRDDPKREVDGAQSQKQDEPRSENHKGGEPEEKSLVIYIPHFTSPSSAPFYHPAVQGIGFLHSWNPATKSGLVSTHYLFFPDQVPERPVKLVRTALALITVLHKHGTGKQDGYVKRVHHDNLVPQIKLQNRYAELKRKHARRLVAGWAESTDPEKHVFEDLGIAAFLIELWEQMYGDSPGGGGGGGERKPFPGFVDIGCGNGLLVYILNLEGYSGWGFDARARKSWEVYKTGEKGKESLKQLVLLPHVVDRPAPATSSPASAPLGDENGEKGEDQQVETGDDKAIDGETKTKTATPTTLNEDMIHDGTFPEGTFIISNHADELTPWTPILATMSKCPFMMIPCCSHDLTGARYRAPPPKEALEDVNGNGTGSRAISAYSSLVSWVFEIARDCGWEPEVEMLRIPSTRNTAIIGRKLMVQNTRNTAIIGRELEGGEVDTEGIVEKYGGTAGYYDAVVKLVGKKMGVRH